MDLRIVHLVILSFQVKSKINLVAYTGAVLFSIGASLGMAKLSSLITFSKTLKEIVYHTSPFFGVVSANAFNLGFSRYKDFSFQFYLRKKWN